MPTSVLDSLKRLGHPWGTSHELPVLPFRFSVSIPEDALRFDEKVTMDLGWMDKKPGQHVIDVQT